MAIVIIMLCHFPTPSYRLDTALLITVPPKVTPKPDACIFLPIGVSIITCCIHSVPCVCFTVYRYLSLGNPNKYWVYINVDESRLIADN